MKIIAINGSHRGKRGYTGFLVEKFLEGVREGGAEGEEITLAELNIKRCAGCFVCQKRDHLLQCIYDGKDDAKEVFEKIKAADALVFASPIYVFMMSELLVNFLDRLPATCDAFDLRISKKGMFFHQIDHEMFSKPFVTIFCQDNVEYETHKNALSYFKTYSKFMDAPYVGSIVRRSGAVAGQGRDEKKLEKYPSLKESYGAIQMAGKEFVQKGKISRGTERTANRPLVNIPLIVKLLWKIKPLRSRIELKIRD